MERFLKARVRGRYIGLAGMGHSLVTTLLLYLLMRFPFVGWANMMHNTALIQHVI